MIAQELLLRPLDLERDAEKLARMWNASDDQWPGTFTEGVPMTAERVLEWMRALNPVEVMLWEDGEEIAGYCSLWAWPKEEDVYYIALLNVPPGHQKLSLGRKFLTYYVDYVVKLGARRLDLHTWSGNLKAMPLYKKCGFFWLPDTSVHMFNYMPAILAMPLARPYFQKHDWYKTLKRDLSQVEDDERWEGMKVFTYRFEEEGDYLTVWVDREARAVTAVETNDIFAAAIAVETEPARGLAAPLRWQLTNKRDRALRASLIAGGTDQLKIGRRETFELAPGESTTIEAEVQVAPDAPEVLEDMPVPAVRSVLVLDGQVLELATGFRPRPAVEVTTEPRFVTLTPGIAQEVMVQLRSRLRQDVEVVAGLVPSAGLECQAEAPPLSLGAGQYAGITARLTAHEAGTYELAVSLAATIDGKEVQLPGATLGVFSLAPGGLLGAKLDGKLRIENDSLRLVVDKVGGFAELFNRGSGEHIAYLGGYAVPPEAPSEYRDGIFDLSIERESGELVAVATMPSRENPGFVLRKRFAVNAGPLLACSFDFENLAAEARRFNAAVRVMEPRGHEAVLTLPLAAGLVRAPFPLFSPPDDEARKPAAYAEPWGALESRAGTFGIIWPAGAGAVEWSPVWEFKYKSQGYECPPQSRVRTAPLYLYVGDGGWEAVRESWRRAGGILPDPNALPTTPKPILSARVEPVVFAGDGAGASLHVEHLISRKLDGAAALVLPAGWHSSQIEFEFEETTWQKPFSAPLELRTQAAPGAAGGRIELRTAGGDSSLPISLVRLGDGSPVQVREAEVAGQRVLTIGNGRIEVDVTPGFGGTVSALRENGVNHLASPFPTVGAFGWMAPWYGGLMPVIETPYRDDFPGKLWRERFSAEPLAVADSRGIGWSGVRQQAELEHEGLRGVILEIDTLTTGGSHVLKHVLRFVNNTRVARRFQTGYAAFVQPDGSHSHSTMLAGQVQLKHAEWNPFMTAGHWGAIQNPETGRTIALISAWPEVRLAGWGAEGGHLILTPTVTIPAAGAVEIPGYLVLAPDAESARHHLPLMEL